MMKLLVLSVFALALINADTLTFNLQTVGLSTSDNVLNSASWSFTTHDDGHTADGEIEDMGLGCTGRCVQTPQVTAGLPTEGKPYSSLVLRSNDPAPQVDPNWSFDVTCSEPGGNILVGYYPPSGPLTPGGTCDGGDPIVFIGDTTPCTGLQQSLSDTDLPLAIGNLCVVIFSAGAPIGSTLIIDNVVLGTNPGVIGDPHFTPLNGDKTVFTPEGPRTPATYNIISHSLMQLNSRWVKKSTQDQLAEKFGLQLRKDDVTTNIRLELRRSKLVVFVDEIRQNSTGVRRLFPGSHRHFLTRPSSSAAVIETPLVVLKFWVAHSNNDFFLDLSVGVEDKLKMTQAHGLLGQTARVNIPYQKLPEQHVDPDLKGCVECYVEGNVGEYIVKDGLFGNDFKYNKF